MFLYFAIKLLQLALTLSMGFTRSNIDQGDTFSAIAVTRSQALRSVHTTILYSSSLELLALYTSPPSACVGAACDTPLTGDPILLIATLKAKQNAPTGLAKITVSAFDDAGGEAELTKYVFIGTVIHYPLTTIYCPLITRR